MSLLSKVAEENIDKRRRSFTKNAFLLSPGKKETVFYEIFTDYPFK